MSTIVVTAVIVVVGGDHSKGHTQRYSITTTTNELSVPLGQIDDDGCVEFFCPQRTERVGRPPPFYHFCSFLFSTSSIYLRSWIDSLPDGKFSRSQACECWSLLIMIRASWTFILPPPSVMMWTPNIDWTTTTTDIETTTCHHLIVLIFSTFYLPVEFFCNMKSIILRYLRRNSRDDVERSDSSFFLERTYEWTYVRTCVLVRST